MSANYTPMSPSFIKRVDELYQSFVEYDSTQDNRINRYRNIEPESALFIAMQIRIQQSQKVLEIGTSTGYSTLWLADAVLSTGGNLTTLEIDPKRTEQAIGYAKELNVDSVIEFVVGDAQEYLTKSHQSNDQYDIILLDAERDVYCQYWLSLKDMIGHKGGVLIVDNVISHASQVEDFIKLVQSDDRFVTTTLPIGAGLFIVTYKN